MSYDIWSKTERKILEKLTRAAYAQHLHYGIEQGTYTLEEARGYWRTCKEDPGTMADVACLPIRQGEKADGSFHYKHVERPCELWSLVKEEENIVKALEILLRENKETL